MQRILIYKCYTIHIFQIKVKKRLNSLYTYFTITFTMQIQIPDIISMLINNKYRCLLLSYAAKFPSFSPTFTTVNSSIDYVFHVFASELFFTAVSHNYEHFVLYFVLIFSFKAFLLCRQSCNNLL